MTEPTSLPFRLAAQMLNTIADGIDGGLGKSHPTARPRRTLSAAKPGTVKRGRPRGRPAKTPLTA